MDVGPASMLVGNLVAGKRIAQATGRELGVVEDQDLIRKVLNPNLHTDTATMIRLLALSSGSSFFQAYVRNMDQQLKNC